jgi:hypothetical protein
MSEEIFTTERDVALDVLAARERSAGTCGSDETEIESVIETNVTNTLLVTLSNGDTYTIQIRERLV